MSVKITGLQEAQAAFNKRMANVETYTARALVDVVIQLTGEAVQLAPVDNGDLRGSGQGEVNGVVVAEGKGDGNIKSSRPNLKSRKMVGIVSFNTPYAVVQHERTDFDHPRGGQAKYLEQPFVQGQDRFIQHLADSVKKAVD